MDEALKEFKRIDILINGELLGWEGGRFGTFGLCCFGLGASGQPVGVQRRWAPRKQRPAHDTWPSLLAWVWISLLSLHQHPPALRLAVLLGTQSHKLSIPMLSSLLRWYRLPSLLQKCTEPA